MTALIYARVSTDEIRQASMPDQIAMAQAQVAALGLPPVPESDVFTDTMSRSIFGRPGLQSLLRRVAQDPSVTHVVVWQTSRLFGDVEQQVRIYRTLRQRRVRLFSSSGDEENLPGAMNKAFAALKAVLHELEVDTTRERVHETHLAKAEDGKLLQRPVFGFGFDKARGHYVDDEAALTVRLIFQWLAEGKTPQWVCDELNSRGIKTQQKAEWRRHNLRRMIRNELYVGTLIWNRTQTIIENDKKRQVPRPRSEWVIRRSPLPAIVDQETFDAAGRQIEMRWKERGGGRGYRKNERRLLDGLVYCGKCNKAMYARRGGHKRAGGKISDYFYYACAAQCSTISEMKLLRALNVESYSSGRQPVDGSLIHSIRFADSSDETAGLTAQVQTIRRKLERAWEAYQEEVVDLAQYKKTKTDLEGQLRAAEARLSDLAEQTQIDGETGAHAALLAELLDLAVDDVIPMEERRAALSDVVDRLVVDRPRVGLLLRQGATPSRS